MPQVARRQPVFHIVLELYPLKPIDSGEALLRGLAINRARAARNREAVPIDSLDDVFTLLDLMAERIAKASGQKKATSFISELHILGHGNPGQFGIGTYMYDSKALKRIPKGRTHGYLEDNAAIYLDGCLAAAGAKGKEFMYEIGRVFLGDKHGTIRGNTGPVIVMGEMTTRDPVSLKYPENVVTPSS